MPGDSNNSILRKEHLSMKIRLFSVLLLAVFCLTLFTGCASVNALQPSAARRSRYALPDPTPAATPAATGPSHPQPDYISKEEAKTVALTHAGVSAADVTRLTAEFDYDDGRPEYDVEFHHGGYEYSYEIHAETGAILSRDKDLED